MKGSGSWWFSCGMEVEENFYSSFRKMFIGSIFCGIVLFVRGKNCINSRKIRFKEKCC